MALPGLSDRAANQGKGLAMAADVVAPVTVDAEEFQRMRDNADRWLWCKAHGKPAVEYLVMADPDRWDELVDGARAVVPKGAG
jgi:hypothetical protein